MFSIGAVLLGTDLFGLMIKILLVVLVIIIGLFLRWRLIRSGNWSGVVGTNFRFPFGDWRTILTSKDGLHLLHLCEKLGNPYVYRIWMGPQPALVLAHPDAVREFWQYHDETKIEREVKLSWALLDIMGQAIGFKPYRARNRISKFFHFCFGPKNINRFHMKIENAITEFMIRLRYLTNNDTLVDIRKELSYLGHDASTYIYLGQKSSRYLNILHELVNEMNHLMTLACCSIWINVVGLRWILPQAYKLRLKTASFRHKWKSLLRTLMSEYKEELKTNKNDNEHINDSMLTRFIQMEAEGKSDVTFEELMDTFTESLFFPSDVVAATTAYTLILLAMNQDVQSFTRELLCNQLIDRSTVTLDDINSIEYLDWILSECQRIFPVQMLNTPEFTSQVMTIAGITVPKNTMVIYDTHSMHRRDDIWDEPLVFRPERFRHLNAKQRKAIHAFGNGRTRRCLGEYFVKSLHKLLIARIVLDYRVQTIDSNQKIDEIPRKQIPLAYAPDICLQFVPL
ncbi:unnamed protein product [Rotaria sp. Silwood1]|nr:unnamed protein product [Rotaria sp. Silwood1]CAF1645786.1 unnamed protein product [Rotaria sp. Silwood1]CAF3793125.1 unnamed protein product [Rotaria sp. Silwood1]CAF3793133.1 unnamed protein product [Rotaria sp. Silwood1]CAF3846757.1 unnamed protein product [Rotaria sp. Silwood1]